MFAAVLVSLPPLAVYSISRATSNRYGEPDFVVYLSGRTGVTFVGGFLFPVLPFVILALALVQGIKRTVNRTSKIILWVFLALSIANCWLVISFFSTRLNK